MYYSYLYFQGGVGLGRVGLTDTDGGIPGPAVVLLADAHGDPDEAEARVALVHHAAAVVVVLPDDLAVHDGLRVAAVTRFKRTEKHQKSKHFGLDYYWIFLDYWTIV